MSWSFNYSIVKRRGSVTVRLNISNTQSICKVRRNGEELFRYLGRPGNHAHDKVRREANIFEQDEETAALGTAINQCLDSIEDDLCCKYGVPGF